MPRWSCPACHNIQQARQRELEYREQVAREQQGVAGADGTSAEGTTTPSIIDDVPLTSYGTIHDLNSDGSAHYHWTDDAHKGPWYVVTQGTAVGIFPSW